jgi:alpha-N-arabinofuranosidase
MYKVHQDAAFIPLEINSETMKIREKDVAVVSATASKKDNTVNITLSNIDLNHAREITFDLADLKVKTVSGRILTSKNIADCNTFEQPETVKPQVFKDAKVTKNILTVKIPAKAILALELK